MITFIESIKVKNGQLCNIFYHNERSSRTIMHFFGIKKVIPFQDIFSSLCNGRNIDDGSVYKFRVIYSQNVVSASIDLYPIKKMISLKLVECDDIDYSFKYEDRSCFSGLLQNKGVCDDVLIVKRGLITDSSYGNVVYGIDGHLFTPHNCLLKGTMRAMLLSEKKLLERDLGLDELNKCSGLFMINAMLDITPVKVIR